jgi:hypothetical protein
MREARGGQVGGGPEGRYALELEEEGQCEIGRLEEQGECLEWHDRSHEREGKWMEWREV